jgi:hypothetical protein
VNLSDLTKLGIAAMAVAGVCVLGGMATASPTTDSPTGAAGRLDAELQPGSRVQKQRVERVVFSEMMFAKKSELSDVGVGRCYLAAQKLKHGTNVRVIIQSRAGASDASALDQALCLERAEAIKQQLRGFGIAESRMSPVRFGEASASFKADWARVVNERAEFEIEAEDHGHRIQ